MGRNLILLGIVIICLCICFIDIRKKIIPNYLSILLGLFSFLYNFNYMSVENIILGGCVYSSFFSLIYGYGSDLLKKDCLGFGDVKLSFSLGILLGYTTLLDVVFFINTTFSLALIVYILFIIFKKIKIVEFPLGPFLILATFIKFINRILL